MPPIRIPGTDKIIFVNNHIGDYVIDMSDHQDVDATIRQEDVRIVGNWEDYSGSGTIGPQEVMLQGIADVEPSSLKGQVLNSDVDVTDRGVSASNKRQRDKLIYIDLTNEIDC